MKKLLVQIIGSSVLLGLMAGSVALHYAHISAAREMGATATWAGDPDSGPIIEIAQERPSPLAGLRRPSESARDGIEVQTVAAMQLVLEELRDLREENQSLRTQMRSEADSLRDQVSEFNRDITELQFRVDSHSESFRPLRVAPDRFARREAAHPLLPPKR
ncbi:MAG: hypothetical protein HKN82_06765 [Akkermansiaceae bacterium]|nr:hypothetical protein [Akkermansiaceae bacterium]NNM28417.1 hypothetical protein [Akkermansiaceae bacterium]